MGVRICKPCSQEGKNEEIIFSNRNKTSYNASMYSKLYNLNTNYNLTEAEYTKLKTSLDLKLKEKGEFIQNFQINNILSTKNPLANEINISEEILINNIKSQPNISVIKEPMIQFQNGEIYEGGWNSNNQRHGFGISINKENNV